MLTTHAGSLPRTPELTALLVRRSRRAPVDPGALERAIVESTRRVVARQLAAVAAALAARGLPARRSHLRAAACALGVAAITLAVNEPANQRFAAPGTLGDAEARALLARWVAWHWVRVALGVGGFLAALRALTGTRPRSGSAPGRS